MPDKSGRKAVVIGAGMAGMPAARVLADHFDQVIVIENDALPVDASPRPGTPQCKQLHVLLAGGQRALSSLFPGFEQTLVAAGANVFQVARKVEMQYPGYDSFPKRDLGFSAYGMTRPLLESVVRKHFSAIRNITVRQRCRAQRLMTSEDGTRVVGVSCLHSNAATEDIRADVVVDASGNGRPTLDLLAEISLPAPEEANVTVKIGYASALFEIPRDAPSDWQVVVTIPEPPEHRRGAFLVPVEGNRWIVGLQGSNDVKPPGDNAGFLEFTRKLRTPTIYNAIKNAKRCTPITRYGFKASRWRHFEALEKFPSGLIPIGDTVSRFNPIYGQGMSVAAEEACLLRDLLQAAAEDGKGFESLSGDFLDQAQPIIDAPWNLSVIPDLLDPLTEGERPPDLEDALNFNAGLLRLAYEDEEIHRLMVEVQHLIQPRSVLQDPEIVDRVNAVMAREEKLSKRAS